MTIRGPVFTVQPQTYKPWDPARPNYLVTVLSTIPAARKFKQIPDERPWPPYSPPADVLFPNIAIRTTVARPKTVAIFDRPWSAYSPPADFVFPNVALQAFAQSLVHPQGATLDESVPAVFPRPIDFQFANVAALDAAQRLVKSPPPKLDLVVPSPQPRQVDLLPPNLLVIQPTGGKPAANPIFDRPAPAIQVQDFLFANLLTSTLSATYSPVGAIWGPWPQPPPRQLEFSPRNLAILPAPPQVTFRPPLISRPAPVVQPIDFQFPNPISHAPAAGKPRFAPIFERPIAASLPVDFLFPNITVGVIYAPASGLWQPLPPPAVRADFQFPNVVVQPAPSTVVFRPPLISRPTAPKLPIDAPLPNLVINQPVAPPVQAVFRPPLISRPVATQLPIDAPLPNLLTTTLSVAAANPVGSIVFVSRPAPTQLPIDAPLPNLLTTTLSVSQKPPFNFIFERPTPPALPWDVAPINLLPTLLQTIARKPIVPNLFLFADRPSPQAPPVDFPPENALVFKPPPVVSAELHQNPFFTTMGRLSQLGNLPS